MQGETLIVDVVGGDIFAEKVDGNGYRGGAVKC